MKNFVAIVLLCVVFCGCAAQKSFQKGKTFASLGEWDLAVAHYQKAYFEDPKNINYKNALERAKLKAKSQHFEKGNRFLTQGEYDAAILEYQLALVFDPSFKEVQLAITRAKRLKDSDYYYQSGLKLAEIKRPEEAKIAFQKALELNPENKKAEESIKELQRKERPPKPEAIPTQPITLRLKETSIKEAFEILSRLSKINLVLDKDIRDYNSSVFLDKVSFQQALDILTLSNELESKAIAENTILVFPRTTKKLQEYQDLMVRTFYVNYVETKAMSGLLKSVLKLKDIAINEDLNAIIVRDTPGALEICQRIIEANDLPTSELVLDVEIIEANRKKVDEIGFKLSPYSVSMGLSANRQKIVSGGLAPGASTEDLLSYSQLTNLSKNYLFFTMPTVTLDLLKQDSDTKVLANPQIRVKNNQKAKIHIGDRVPLRSSKRYTEEMTGWVVDYIYQDIGIRLMVQPTISLPDEVSLKMTLEISSIGAQVGDPSDPQYIIGTRNTETVVQIREGETVLIGGLLKEEDVRSATKIPFLGDIPFLGRLFASASKTKAKTDILMSITPHIIRKLDIPSKEVTTFWSGKGEVLSTEGPSLIPKEVEKE